MKNKVPITYTGSNTENLYVLGIRNGREIKLKVKEIGCHGPIRVDGVIEDNESYTDESSLKEAAEKGELINNTVYIINDNGDEKKYIYYNDELVPMGLAEDSEVIPVGGLTIGTSFDNFQELKTALDNGTLKADTIYTVTDKGTIEQYILRENNLIQIAGNLNEIISGNEENEDEKSSTLEDEDGIIDYNLPELVNGDYRFKNHSNITTVYCDMPSLISGVQMFYGTSLKSFCGNLSSLDNGRHMFSKGCKLDEESIISIIDGIKDWSFDTAEHIIEIGYDSSKVSASFISDVEKEFISKGWIVNWKPDGILKINLSK